MFYLNKKPLRSQGFIPNTEPGLEVNNIINDNDAYFNSIFLLVFLTCKISKT